MDARELRDHFESLCEENDVTFLYTFKDWRDSYAQPLRRRVVCAPIRHTVEYFAAMHELGHILAPDGDNPQAYTLARFFRNPVAMDVVRNCELAAWDWAEKHALLWTRVAKETKRSSLATYR